MTTTNRNPVLDNLDAAEVENVQWLFNWLKEVHADAQTYSPDELDDGEGNVGIDVRVYLMDDGSARYCSGDASYDQDHRGYCGSGFVPRESDEWQLTQVARDMIDQAMDAAYMSL